MNSSPINLNPLVPFRIRKCIVELAIHVPILYLGVDLTIGQIAESAGYSITSRLATLHRESTGLMPAEYRKMSWRT